jgi:protein-L-isoaspartate(D-aspartate) O-methyltransferase
MVDFERARQAMVDCQVRPADVTRYAIIEAMLSVPRERFVPRARREVAYAGTEIPIADSRVLLEPRVLAKMIEEAEVDARDLVLDLAPGTGYSTAVLAHIAEAVVAIEPEESLARLAQETLAALEVDNAAVSTGDPALGDPAHGPFDVIFLNGAVERLPEGLAEQLKPGGRLVALFAEGDAGKCRVLTRSRGAFTERDVFDATAPVLPGFERPAMFEF